MPRGDTVTQMELPMFDHCAQTFKPSEARAFGVERYLECSRIQECCGPRLDWPDFLRRAGGYHLPTTDTVHPVPDLPLVIHSIKGDRSHLEFLPVAKGAVWAVPYSRALAGDLEDPRRLQDWLQQKNLFAQRVVLLHQEERDRTLESLFLKTHWSAFFPILRSAPNCLCVSPGYSVYDDGSMCRTSNSITCGEALISSSALPSRASPAFPLWAGTDRRIKTGSPTG